MRARDFGDTCIFNVAMHPLMLGILVVAWEYRSYPMFRTFAEFVSYWTTRLPVATNLGQYAGFLRYILKRRISLGSDGMYSVEIYGINNPSVRVKHATSVIYESNDSYGYRRPPYTIKILIE